MSARKKISLPNLTPSGLTVLKVEDGKVYFPIPLELLHQSGISPAYPVTIAVLDVGGLYIFNPTFTNPDFVNSLMSKNNIIK